MFVRCLRFFPRAVTEIIRLIDRQTSTIGLHDRPPVVAGSVNKRAGHRSGGTYHVIDLIQLALSADLVCGSPVAVLGARERAGATS